MGVEWSGGRPGRPIHSVPAGVTPMPADSGWFLSMDGLTHACAGHEEVGLLLSEGLLGTLPRLGTTWLAVYPYITISFLGSIQ